jgi:negative regulator of flagellin synthesis FlgM
VKISNEQIARIRAQKGSLTPDAAQVDTAVIKLTDQALIQQVTGDVLEMADREEVVAQLKARIEAGTYSPTGEEIADAMIRRNIADRIR